MFIILLFISCQAIADTVNTRCGIYPAGTEKATVSMPCIFSRRQDGVDYELSPRGDKPENYVDQQGKAAYRNSGIGEQGQIFCL